MGVKRFEPIFKERDEVAGRLATFLAQTRECEDGDYVLHSDYAALEKRLEKLDRLCAEFIKVCTVEQINIASGAAGITEKE